MADRNANLESYTRKLNGLLDRIEDLLRDEKDMKDIIPLLNELENVGLQDKNEKYMDRTKSIYRRLYEDVKTIDVDDKDKKEAYEKFFQKSEENNKFFKIDKAIKTYSEKYDITELYESKEQQIKDNDKKIAYLMGEESTFVRFETKLDEYEMYIKEKEELAQKTIELEETYNKLTTSTNLTDEEKKDLEDKINILLADIYILDPSGIDPAKCNAGELKNLGIYIARHETQNNKDMKFAYSDIVKKMGKDKELENISNSSISLSKYYTRLMNLNPTGSDLENTYKEFRKEVSRKKEGIEIRRNKLFKESASIRETIDIIKEDRSLVGDTVRTEEEIDKLARIKAKKDYRSQYELNSRKMKRQMRRDALYNGENKFKKALASIGAFLGFGERKFKQELLTTNTDIYKIKMKRANTRQTERRQKFNDRVRAEVMKSTRNGEDPMKKGKEIIQKGYEELEK